MKRNNWLIIGLVLLLFALVAFWAMSIEMTYVTPPSEEAAPYMITMPDRKTIYVPSYKLDGGRVILEEGYWIRVQSSWEYREGVTIMPTDTPITIIER